MYTDSLHGSKRGKHWYFTHTITHKRGAAKGNGRIGSSFDHCVVAICDFYFHFRPFGMTVDGGMCRCRHCVVFPPGRVASQHTHHTPRQMALLCLGSVCILASCLYSPTSTGEKTSWRVDGQGDRLVPACVDIRSAVSVFWLAGLLDWERRKGDGAEARRADICSASVGQGASRGN